MYIEYVNDLDESSLMQTELFNELFLMDSEFEHEKKRQELEKRASELKCKTAWNNLYRSFKRQFKKELSNMVEQPERFTDFEYLNDQQLKCGEWIADDNGIYILTEKGKMTACPHPIWITRILKNAESGQYKVELEFKIRGHIRSTRVDRSVIATPTKIISLSDDSVQVNGLTAPYLVKYLADLESLNPNLIQEVTSTSRLGWITDRDDFGNETTLFLPYDKEIIFDNEKNTKSLFDSIRNVGSASIWYDLIRELRQRNRIEFLINMAASYASVLVEPCGALPFIVSLWGGTGLGKTVILMLATSVWADPSEGQYMTDAKATATAMEIRLNILNSLPMTLDDMAQIKNQQDEDFSQLIYRWCAGKGRDRSNASLGLNKLTSWRNCTITNGERSLVDESTQGGAVNRVIDIEADGTEIFGGEDGNRVANTVRANYGHSGIDFIQLIEELGTKEINSIKDKWFKAIKEEAKNQGCEKEDKQIMPMTLILTADELTEKYLFKDGVRLDLTKCVSFLKNKGEVSEHKRAYEWLLGQIESNKFHFADNRLEPWEKQVAYWGFWDAETTVAIIPTVFDKLLKEGSFQSRAFKSWAKKEGLLETDNRRVDKMFRVGNSRRKYIVLKTDIESGEFNEITDEEVPF